MLYEQHNFQMVESESDSHIPTGILLVIEENVY